MSIDATISDDPPADLPPQTWCQWWNRLPGYWRIGARSAGALLVLHGLLAVRLWIGEIEPAEVQALRQPGQFVSVDYQHDRLPVRDPRIRCWINRLKWHSRLEVEKLECGPGVDDDKLRFLCDTFPNLKDLRLYDGQFTPQGLRPLARLGVLEGISFIDSNLDDQMVRELVPLNALQGLLLDGSYVTDAVGPTLLQMPNLNSVSVRYTEVSAEAAQAWAATPRSGLPKLAVRYEWNTQPICCGFRFRWADGRQSYRILRFGTCKIEGPLGSDFSQQFNQDIWLGYIQMEFMTFLSRAMIHADGEYVATIRFGEFESEPVRFLFERGKTGPDRMEFRMPVTKAEVLKATPPPPWIRSK